MGMSHEWSCFLKGISMRLQRLAVTSLLVALFYGCLPSPGVAQESPAVPKAEATPAVAAPEGDSKAAVPGTPAAESRPQALASSQDLLLRKYARFVETMRKIAESIRKTDPERAELLNRAIGKSNAEQIPGQLSQLVALLRSESKLQDALDSQEEVVADMQLLLKLLMSEDEREKNKAEQARIEAYIKKLNEIINQQRDTRAATERKEDADALTRRQKKIADKAHDLNEQIQKDDAEKEAKEGAESKPQEGDAKPGDPKNGKPPAGKESETKDPDAKKPDGDKPEGEKPEGKKPEAKPMEGEPKPGEPQEGMPKEGEPKAGKPQEGEPKAGKPMDGMPKEGMPMDGMPMDGMPKEGESKEGDSQPPQEQKKTPGREELKKAKEEMEKAIEKLKKKAHDPASDHQDAAVKELQKAKEKLEEILRQLREEELLRTLQALEARFQNMLTLQLQVYDDTRRLDRTPAKERTTVHYSKAHELSRKEDEIVLEMDRTLIILREEGSAVAFPEAAEQIREDMLQVVQFLGRQPDDTRKVYPDTGELTQVIEKDIINALEEMVEALQKEIEKKEEKKKDPQQQQQQGEEQEPGLVDKLAELKVLRSLQYRVNNRTRRLARMFPGEQAQDPAVLDQLRGLADRQARIQKAAYDLATGRNK